ncbi:MAG: DUF1704 domain-containing protein [Ilumatobacteraceae bacterium]
MEKEWLAISRTFSVETFLTPLNRSEELAKVVAGIDRFSPYEPKFVFNPVPNELVDVVSSFGSRLLSDGYWWDILRTEVDRVRMMLSALASRSPAEITAASSFLYGLPSPEVLTLARTVLSEVQRVPHEEAECDSIGHLDAAETRDHLLRALMRAGLSEWNVVVEPSMNSRMSVRSAARLVRVRGDVKLTKAELRRLVVHELGTHVVRAVNGALQPGVFFEVGFPGYLSTEEGLASHNEMAHGVSDGATRRRIALRALGVDMAVGHSFFETALFLAKFTTSAEAVEISMRVKRGIESGAADGTYSKDHVYLTGEAAVRSLLTERPDDEPLLSIGKVGVREIPMVREMLELGHLVPPRTSVRSFLAE